MQNADQWTLRLAAVLAGDIAEHARADALAALVASHATGQARVDQTRQRILTLLAQLEGVTLPMGEVPADLPPQDMTPISLIAVDHGPAPLSVEAVATWLAAAVDEVVLVDPHSTPPLAHRLREAGLSDPRLRVIRADEPGVTWAQSFNIGISAAAHPRVWLVSDSARLTGQTPPPLPPGSFASDPGFGDGSGFVLDLWQADLMAAGGFNEYLESPDWAVEDLGGRLGALGLQRRALTAGLLIPANPPAPPQPAATSASLRDTLRQAPGFAALQNRFIAAAMPDWTAASPAPCSFSVADDLGQHVQRKPASPAKPPLHIKTDAATHALIDLLRHRLGGQPERLSPRRLDMVLARPANDVFATDIAVAASNAPELVKSRKGWLVLTVSPDAVPLPGTPAAQGLATLEQMARHQGQSPVLLVDGADTAAALAGHTACPVVVAPLDISAFWPTELRELAQPLGDRAPRHAKMPFTPQTLADLTQLNRMGPALLLRRPKLFIDAQHGLGNRMRAIASAGAIAAGTDRELVIIWQPDDHCACTYDDLFVPQAAVLSQGFAPEAASMGMALFNYMEIEPGGAKDAPIDMATFQDVYIRSAFPLNSPCSNWHTENAWITKLRPNEVVRDLVASVRNPNDLSVHIRMEGGPQVAHLPYESPANWSAQAQQDITHWRERSHFSHFLPRLDALITEGLADRVFLATDTPAVYDELAERYGARIAWLPRPASDRSAKAIVYALADAILLGRAPRLLGSTWSSFSELASRLAPNPMQVELSGRDF